MPPAADPPYLFAGDLPIGGLATDARPALQASIDQAQAQRRPLGLPAQLNLRLGAPLVIRHGQAAAGDPHRFGLTLYGNDCTLFPAFAGPAIRVVPRCRRADAATGRGEAHVELRDLGFHGGQNADARAIEWGAPGFQCSNFRYSLIENVLVEGFDQPNAVRFTSCRKIVLDRLVCRPGAELRIRCPDAGGFAGDMIFRACEFAGKAAVRPLYAVAGNAGGQAQLRGLDFINCTFYGGGTLLQGRRQAHVGDFKFTSCRWDAPAPAAGEHAIELHGVTAGETVLSKISILDPYLVGYRGYALLARGAGDFRTIKLHGGEVHRVAPQGVPVSAVVLLDGVGGVSIRGVDFYDCAAGALISVSGRNRPCRGLAIQDNLARAGSIGRLVELSPHAHDDYIITANAAESAETVADATSGSPKRLVSANLKLTG